jgi:hypothetical protein
MILLMASANVAGFYSRIIFGTCVVDREGVHYVKSERGCPMRKKMLAAALLPLPFAAIPVFAVAFGGTTAQNGDLALDHAPAFEVAVDANVIRVDPAPSQDEPLAFTGGDHKLGCLDVEGGI